MINLEKLDVEQTTQEIEVIYDVPAPVRATDVVYAWSDTRPAVDHTSSLAIFGAFTAGLVIALVIMGLVVSFK